MEKNERTVGAIYDLPDGRFRNSASLSGFVSEEFWCSVMRKDETGVEQRKSASVAAEPVCGKLKRMFDASAAEPMPDALAILFDRLEVALERGELFDSRIRLPRN